MCEREGERESECVREGGRGGEEQVDSLVTEYISIATEAFYRQPLIVKSTCHLRLVPAVLRGAVQRVPVAETPGARRDKVPVRSNGGRGTDVTPPPRHTLHTLALSRERVTHSVISHAAHGVAVTGEALEGGGGGGGGRREVVVVIGPTLVTLLSPHSGPTRTPSIPPTLQRGGPPFVTVAGKAQGLDFRVIVIV